MNPMAHLICRVPHETRLQLRLLLIAEGESIQSFLKKAVQKKLRTAPAAPAYRCHDEAPLVREGDG